MYTVSEFANKVGVTVHTVQRWDREGRLPAKRTLSGRRYYTDEDVAFSLGISYETAGKIVAYCRVSSPSQKDDLVNQRLILEQFCAEDGLSVDEWIEEIGSGLNLRRKKFLSLIDMILNKELSALVIAHKDRLSRFGFELISYLCEKSGCRIVIMDDEGLSPEQEVTQDLMAIVHTFSSRLYGLRNYRKVLQKALEDDTKPQD